MSKSLPTIRWPEVVAAAVCVTGFAMLGLYFHSYSPKPFSDAEIATARAKALANCGYSMFDVEPKSMSCPSFDEIGIDVGSGCWPDCDQYSFTLRADGTARMVVIAPESERGTFDARVGGADFRRLSNLLATLALDRRGDLAPLAPDMSEILVRAGCGGQTVVYVNVGGERDEVPAFAQCLADVKASADWNKR